MKFTTNKMCNKQVNIRSIQSNTQNKGLKYVTKYLKLTKDGLYECVKYPTIKTYSDLLYVNSAPFTN